MWRPYTEDECEVCHQNYRRFYRTLNNNLVLLCPECECVWTAPGVQVSDETLCDHFGVLDVDDLFEGNGSGWATRREVLQDPKWRAALDRIGRIQPDF